jgi:hypothetical protein
MMLLAQVSTTSRGLPIDGNVLILALFSLAAGGLAYYARIRVQRLAEDDQDNESDGNFRALMNAKVLYDRSIAFFGILLFLTIAVLIATLFSRGDPNRNPSPIQLKHLIEDDD